MSRCITSFLLVILSITVTVFEVWALSCYHCDNVTSPKSCNTRTICSTGENCFTEASSNQSQNIFKLGCRSPSACTQQAVIGKRDTVVNTHCSQCCGVDECNVYLCTSDDGGWSTWSEWDSCSVTCGTGLTKKHRLCNNPTPSPSGKSCDGDSTDSKLCQMDSCVTAVNGQWENWSSWSRDSSDHRITCTLSYICRCIRSRRCSGPFHGGQQCIGTPTQTRSFPHC